MMSLLARILSHGFALAVVAIIVIVLMYRGEFIPGWELPEFLAIQKQPDTTAEVDAGTVARTAEEATRPAAPSAMMTEPSAETATPLAPPPAPATSDDAPAVEAPESTEAAEEAPLAPVPAPAAPSSESPAVVAPEPPEAPEEAEAPSVPAPAASSDIPPAVAPESAEESTITGEMDATSNEIESVDEMPAVGEAEDVAPFASSDSATAPGSGTAEAADETSTTEAAASTDSTDQAIEDAAVPAADALPEELGRVTDDALSTGIEETAPPADAAPVAAAVAPVTVAPTAVDETTPADTEPVTAEVVPVETTPAAVEEPESTADIAPATQQPHAAPDSAEVSGTANETATGSPYEVMAKARESYWLRDFDTAERHYQELTRIDPDNPDGFGEMGNMYFSQGKWEQAAAAFYEAGTRLVRQGHLVQAQQIVEVIRGLNGPQAEDLEAQVAAASN